MDTLKENIATHISKEIISKPVFFDLSQDNDHRKLQELFNSGSIQRVSDDYEEQQLELFGVNNPSKVYTPFYKQEFKTYFDNLDVELPHWQRDVWVFFPWSSTLVHVLNEEDFWLVRTNRNRNLINNEEQKKFYNAKVGIGGLSVGSGVALALVLQGGPKTMKLADMDRLALSNTNRVLSGVENLGVLKVEMVARKIYEINPYAEIEIFPEGLNPDNIERFFDGLDIVVDELDNLAVKYLIREQAKKHGIAVVMAADNGDNAVVDIERYDLDPNTPFFHNRMGEVSYESLSTLDKFGIGKKIAQHIGPENITEATFNSFIEMGKTIVSWPQLGGAAIINGAAVAYCIRKILNDQNLENNRAIISLDQSLIPSYSEASEIKSRKEITTKIKTVLNI